MSVLVDESAASGGSSDAKLVSGVGCRRGSHCRSLVEQQKTDECRGSEVHPQLCRSWWGSGGPRRFFRERLVVALLALDQSSSDRPGGASQEPMPNIPVSQTIPWHTDRACMSPGARLLTLEALCCWTASIIWSPMRSLVSVA